MNILDFISGNTFKYSSSKYLVKIIAESSDLEINDLHEHRTYLHWTSFHGRHPVVKYLIKSGANLEATDKYGYTPLHLASRQGHLSVVKYLLKCGANLESRSKNGFTTLQIAVRHNRLPIVKYLLKCGADLDARTYCGETCLDIALQYDTLRLVKYLLESGANPIGIKEIKWFGMNHAKNVQLLDKWTHKTIWKNQIKQLYQLALLMYRTDNANRTCLNTLDVGGTRVEVFQLLLH